MSYTHSHSFIYIFILFIYVYQVSQKSRDGKRFCARPAQPPNDTWALLAPMLATAIRAICGQGRVTHGDPITRRRIYHVHWCVGYVGVWAIAMFWEYEIRKDAIRRRLLSGFSGVDDDNNRSACAKRVFMKQVQA